MTILSGNRRGGSSGAPTGLAVATLDLTSAQILALNTTPIQAIAAPGANKLLWPVAVTFFLDAAVVYATNTKLLLNYAATNIDAASSAPDFLAQAADTVSVDDAATALTGTSLAATSLVNKALNAKADGGDPTLGTGTVRIVVLYQTVSVA